MEEKVQRVHQAEGETLVQTIERALTVARVTEGQGLGEVQLRERSFGCTVAVGSEDTMETVVNRLNAEYQRRIAEGEIEPPVSPDVPDENRNVPWFELHPVLQEVVLCKLYEEIEHCNSRIAKGGVLSITTGLAVSKSFGPMAPLVGAGAGAATAGQQDADIAIRRAFEAALAVLAPKGVK